MSNKIQELEERCAQLERQLAESRREVIKQQKIVEDEQQRAYLPQSVIENMQDGLAIVDKELNIVYMNTALCTLVGFSLGEMMGQHTTGFVHSDDFPKVIAGIQNRKEGVSGAYEIRACHKNGHFIPVTIEATPLLNIRGEFYGSFAILKDLSKNKDTEQNLRHTIERLESIQEIEEAIVAARSWAAIAQVTLARLRKQVSFSEGSVAMFDFDHEIATQITCFATGRQSTRTLATNIELNTLQEFIDELRLGQLEATEELSLLPRNASLKHFLMSEHSNLQSLFYQPLIAEGELVGLFILAAQEKSVFSGEVIEIVREIAQPLALAIQQAQLHEKIQRHADELEQRVEERTFELTSVNMQLEREIGERKRAEGALRRSDESIRALLNAIVDPIMLTDLQGNVIAVNEVMQSLYGKSAAELIGTCIYDLHTPEEVSRGKAMVAAALETGKVASYETYLGSKIYDSCYIPIFDDRGQPERLAMYGRDITQSKRVAEALQEAKDAADTANKAKTTFLANMTHELRTPMNAIIGISKMLGRQDAQNLRNNQREGMFLIHQSGEKLLRLIDELLDLSKIEAGKMEVQLRPLSVTQLFTEVNHVVKSLIGIKSIHYEVVRDESLPDMIISDEEKLNKILLNILGNAVKFTEGGTITLTLERSGENLICIVKDSGLGISAAQLPFIFDEFKQVDSSPRRKFPGTGLGLALCKKMVALLKGSITADSELHKGTTISFSIPLLEVNVPALK